MTSSDLSRAMQYIQAAVRTQDLDLERACEQRDYYLGQLIDILVDRERALLPTTPSDDELDRMWDQARELLTTTGRTEAGTDLRVDRLRRLARKATPRVPA